MRLSKMTDRAAAGKSTPCHFGRRRGFQNLELAVGALGYVPTALRLALKIGRSNIGL
jgi:hypothetical protein